MNPETFLPAFEKQLSVLKRTFQLPTTPEWQQELMLFKQWVQRHQPDGISHFSSMFAVPTSKLVGSEQMLHRIWLGGTPPSNVVRAIAQWQQAIVSSGSDFQQTLWVWDSHQLANDPRFICQLPSNSALIGVLFLPDALVQVQSLSALMQPLDAALTSVLQQLHARHYYATLSDFFRLAILAQFGGVYMDADTLPAQPATLFLCQPELPDFIGEQQQPISWLNLFVDETGMIIAHQQDTSLVQLHQHLADIYRRWPLPLPNKTPQTERAIFEPFYRLWCQQLQVSQMSHHEFSRNFAISGFDMPQSRIAGIKGMRLQEDILSGERHLLDQEEQQHYEHTIEQLTACHWQLKDPLQLAECAPLFAEHDVLQIAYAPQLRSEIPYYHYYSVLSQDPQLDKVNNLFSDYLIASNQQQILAGNYWKQVRAQKPLSLWFKPGLLTSESEQRAMAELIFSTSYLEYCSVDNIYATDIITLQLRQNILPFLEHISVLYDSNAKIVGFFNASAIKYYDNIQLEYAYRSEIRPLDDAYDRFVERYSQADDFFLCSLAIQPQQQGKGYFNQVLIKVKEQAIQQKLRRITLCVWQSTKACQIYRNKGFRTVAVLDKEMERFNDKLIFMALEL